MSETARQLTPVEMAKSEIFEILEDKDFTLNVETMGKIREAFECAMSYESEYQSDRFKVSDMHLQEYREENRMLRIQLRVLTKYIEGHNI